jgi:DNA-binding NarL/FixJ family response regulator
MARRPSQLRILLADDHELVRRGIRGLLSSKRNWKVVAEARDGLEAIEKAKKLKPDVIILDIDMPKLNGLEATPLLRQAAPDTKIVVLTLHESGEMVRRALEAGAQGFVLKSDLAERLVTAVQEISHAKLFLTSQVSELVTRALHYAQDEKHLPEPRPKPSSREVEVIRLLAEGRANKEIAATLGISVRTAETHRANIMRKLCLRSLAELVHYAIRNGMTATGQPNTARVRFGDY